MRRCELLSAKQVSALKSLSVPVSKTRIGAEFLGEASMSCPSTDTAYVVINADFVILRSVPTGPISQISALGVAALRSRSMDIAAIRCRTRAETDIIGRTAIASHMGCAGPEPTRRIGLRKHTGIEGWIITGVIDNAL